MVVYLEKVKSKGRVYLYLRKYDGSIEFGTKKVTLYRFGNLEKALKNMNAWKASRIDIPDELKALKCVEKDIEHWITKLTVLEKENENIEINKESDPYGKYSSMEKLFYGDLLRKKIMLDKMSV